LDTENFKIKTKTKTILRKSAKRNEFSAEDDKIFLDYLKEQNQNGFGLSGNKIYQAFAEKVRPCRSPSNGSILNIQLSRGAIAGLNAFPNYLMLVPSLVDQM